MKKIFITAGLAICSIVFGQNQVGINTPQPHQNAALEVFSESKGFLPPRLTTEQRDAIDPIPAGLTIYNSTINCMQYWNSQQWKGDCEEEVSPGIITNCSDADLLQGTYQEGIDMTTSNTMTLKVNVDHIGSYTISSNTVNGITFTGTAHFIATGAQEVTLTANGIPTASGDYEFTFTFGNSTCARSISFEEKTGTIETLQCTGTGVVHNGTLIAGISATNVTSTIPYTGGNGGTYPDQSTPSTGVVGLTAKLVAGNFANGDGTLTYIITGVAATSGTATFSITIGGKSCSFTRTVNIPPVPQPNLSLSCTGTPVPYTATSTTVNVKGLPVMVSNVIGPNHAFSGSTPTACGVPALGATYIYRLNPALNYLGLSFTRPVSNVKIFVYDLNKGESVSFKVINLSGTPNMTANLLGSSCNSKYTLTQYTSTASLNSNSTSTTTKDAAVINFGGSWMSQIEITPYNTTSNILIGICIGDTY